MYALPELDQNKGNAFAAMQESPRLDYKINSTKAGTYYAHVLAADGGGDSLHIGLYENIPETGVRLDGDYPGGRRDGGGEFGWVNLLNTDILGDRWARFEVLSPGVHTFNLWMREDGTIVDKVLISPMTQFNPGGKGPSLSGFQGDPGKPAPEKTVLFVVDGQDNDGRAKGGDPALMDHLKLKRNWRVGWVDDGSSLPIQADGKDLIVVSSTVSSGSAVSGILQLPLTVPVLNWEQASQDELQLTGNTSGTDRGTLGGQTELELVHAKHPLAGGGALSDGKIEVVNSPQTFSWGNPGPNAANAIKIAHVAGNPDQWLIYGYDKGAALFDGTPSPTRRVHLFLGDDTSMAANSSGLFLFDAAVNWF